MRCTLAAMPQTQELLKKARLPLGIECHPFKDMKVLWILSQCRRCEIDQSATQIHRDDCVTIPLLSIDVSEKIISSIVVCRI